MQQFPSVSLIGAPTDIGAGHRGASMGPEALRVAGIAEALHARGLDVVDRGNLAGPFNPWLPPHDGYRHLAEVVDLESRSHAGGGAELALERLPILLGGDHCLAIGSISAVAQPLPRARQETAHALARRARRFQHLDDHAVRQHPRHAGRVSVRLRPARADRARRQRAPMLDDSIRQIGIRSVDAGEKHLVHDIGLDIYDMRYIDEIGMKRAMEEALARRRRQRRICT